MIATEVYLTEEEQTALFALSERTGRSQNELIREAVAALLAHERDQEVESERLVEQRAALAAARGIWKDRTDLPDFAAIRRELDRDWDDR